MMLLQVTPEQAALLLDLKAKADEFARLASEAVALAKEGKHAALVMLDAAPQASFEAIKVLISARKAFGIYRDDMKENP